jgi:carboxypeptidase T
MKVCQVRPLFLLIMTALLLSSMCASGPPLAAGGTPAPDAQPQDQGPWVVRAYYTDRQMVNDLAAWLEPWEVHHDEGYLVVAVDRAGYDRMLESGFHLEFDQQLTDELNRPRAMLPGQTSGIPGFPCYRTVEETFATAQQIVAAHPHLATWIDIGDSWEKTESGGNPGYDMRVLHLTNLAIPGPKPKLFVMASVHAREYTTAELATRFAEYLAQNYGTDPDVTWLIDYHEIHLLLQANPDGRKKAEAGNDWRKNTNEDYCLAISNRRGADLNRNFEFQWGCCGGSSGFECDETYRGPDPASEPETQAIQDYVRSQFPDQRGDGLEDPAPGDATGVFLDLHSYGQLVLWPWGFVDTPAPNSAALQMLGLKFAYYNGYAPEQAYGLYPTDGTTDDFAYGDLGLAAYTFELGTRFFEECDVFENTILPGNLPALLYAAKVVRTPYQTPAGPDVLNLSVSPQGMLPGEGVTLTATLDDTRYNHAYGSESTREIAAAEYYVDVPSWVTSPPPAAHPMAAADGAFDQPIEEVEASLDTAALGRGRHIIFVRGQDANGQWGAFSAVFVKLTARTYLPLVLSAR